MIPGTVHFWWMFWEQPLTLRRSLHGAGCPAGEWPLWSLLVDPAPAARLLLMRFLTTWALSFAIAAASGAGLATSLEVRAERFAWWFGVGAIGGGALSVWRLPLGIGASVTLSLAFGIASAYNGSGSFSGAAAICLALCHSASTAERLIAPDRHDFYSKTLWTLMVASAAISGLAEGACWLYADGMREAVWRGGWAAFGAANLAFLLYPFVSIRLPTLLISAGLTYGLSLVPDRLFLPLSALLPHLYFDFAEIPLSGTSQPHPDLTQLLLRLAALDAPLAQRRAEAAERAGWRGSIELVRAAVEGRERTERRA